MIIVKTRFYTRREILEVARRFDIHPYNQLLDDGPGGKHPGAFGCNLAWKLRLRGVVGVQEVSLLEQA